MLAAAVAAGVTGVFGAPISGVIFGMEVSLRSENCNFVRPAVFVQTEPDSMQYCGLA
jgi:H+/Cl- antiporter ClcA